MSQLNISDSDARKYALNPAKSFIVQAPAGSGKTELLTQRVLNLLSYVERPEECVALTFTKKAAAEMRDRIIESLQAARDGVEPPAHKVVTNNLALKVLQQDKNYSWQLLKNPARLNITTIDSFCAKLAGLSPIVSKLGGSMEIADEPILYYKQAIRELFKLIDTDNFNHDCDWTLDLKVLLQHFSSNYNKLQNFLLEMLYKREQWLPYIGATSDQSMHELMNICWLELGRDVTNAIESVIPSDIKIELTELLEYSAENLKNIYALDSSLNETQECIINHHDSEMAYWQAISYLIFGAADKLSFRKRLDKRLGFYAKSQFADKDTQARALNNKNKLLNLISELSELSDNYADFINSFALLRKLPTFDYSKDNWELLSTLFRVLVLLEAELRVIFKNNQLTDFSGIAQAALYSLGEDDNPSDISLYLDYSIKHILVDEFQDTSYTQYKLLEKLTLEWQHGDGKTLFLVGDPQQSIYRFRQAEVGLFLQVKERGLGSVKLDFLSLHKNFRSEAQIVQWVNNKFKNIFPISSNILLGAVSYDKSEETKELNNSLEPKLNLFVKDSDADRLTQNDFICQSIQKIIKDIAVNSSNIVNCQQSKKTSIAILVRNRSKVLDLISRLKDNNIKINAVDIELLANKMIIKDLLSLTKAVLDLSDRVAWYSILRAPWCGLKLDDLYLINTGNENRTIWDALQDVNGFEFSSDAKSKLNNIVFVFSNIFSKLYKVNFYKLIQQAWLALGGNIIYNTKQDLYDAEQFFQLLFRLEKSNYIESVDDLIREVEKLYANQNTYIHGVHSTENSDVNYTLDIMTIHKSKGLQFDYVFLPYLDATTKVNPHQMLAWQQYHNQNVNGILLAPYHFKQSEQVKFYDAIRFIEQQKEQYELARLFYVAVTRAVCSCVLTAELTLDSMEVLQTRIAEHNDLDEANVMDTSDLKCGAKSILGSLLQYLNPNDFYLHTSFNQNNEHNLHLEGISTNKVDRLDGIKNLEQNQIKYIDYNKYQLSTVLENSQATDAHFNFIVNRTKDLLDFDTITDNPSTYQLEDHTARIIGTFIHKIFYNITSGYLSIDNICHQNNTNAINSNLLDNWKGLLLSQGVALNKINKALDIVKEVVFNIINDDVGKWILDNHEYSYQEYEIYYKTRDNKVKKSIIDRMFIDNDVLWIIDYKISENLTMSGPDSDNDILEEYINQLERYKYLINKYFFTRNNLPKLPIKLALYYPLTSKFVELSTSDHKCSAY